jgi:hypothetical protein
MMRRCAAIALAVLLTCAACRTNNDDGAAFPRVITLGEGDVYAEVVNSSLAVGQNRFMLRLNDANDERIFGATVELRFYDLTEEEPMFASAHAARFVSVETGYVDELRGGTREVTGQDGVYVAIVDFEHSGDWGVLIGASADEDEFDEIPFRFTVRGASDEPMIGDAAPPSVQATTATEPLADIDSSSPGRPAMHDTTIAAALMSRQPAVIAFATPAFCRSRLCAPVMDTVMDPLAAEYDGRAAFIHVEPYLLRDLRDSGIESPVPATLEWRLASEPWIFVVDRDGRIAAKFEGIMAVDEVRAALDAALAQ